MILGVIQATFKNCNSYIFSHVLCVCVCVFDALVAFYINNLGFLALILGP